MTTGESARFRLDLNENPYGPLPSVRRALVNALADANRYPESVPHRVSLLIAARIGCTPDQIVVGPGATGVILYILQAFASGGAKVVMAEPTFDGYPLLTTMVGARPVSVPLGADGSQDLTAIFAAIDEHTEVVVLCNPHNPTGVRLREHELTEFLDRVDPRVTVILDEAYIDFVPSGQRVDPIPLVAAHPNVIVVRTFSKAFGLAGVRVGYAVTASLTAARIVHWQVPFSMNILAEAAVEACYAAKDELNDRVHAIGIERDRLSASLRRFGYVPPSSVANYLFLPLRDPAPAHRISTSFAEAGIRVKHYPAGVRITVGDYLANNTVISCFAESLGLLPTTTARYIRTDVA